MGPLSRWEHGVSGPLQGFPIQKNRERWGEPVHYQLVGSSGHLVFLGGTNVNIPGKEQPGTTLYLGLGEGPHSELSRERG